MVSLLTVFISPHALGACLVQSWRVELDFESKKSLSASLNEKWVILRKNREHLYDSIWSLLGYVTFGILWPRLKLWRYLMALYENPKLDMTENLQSSMFWGVLKLFF
jgi:hypothetical protein